MHWCASAIANPRADHVRSTNHAPITMAADGGILDAARARQRQAETTAADLVLYLCSEAGSGVSGMSLGVCGNVETMRRG